MQRSTEWTHDHIWSILVSVTGGKKKNEAVSHDVRRLVLMGVANEIENQFCAYSDVVRHCEPKPHLDIKNSARMLQQTGALLRLSFHIVGRRLYERLAPSTVGS